MAVRHFLTGLVGTTFAAAIAGLAWLFSPVSPALSAAVFGVCALAPGVALGWILFLAPATTGSADDVESRWLRDASSGTATDLITAMGVMLAVVSITRVDISTSVLLVALLLMAFASCTMRYALARRRTLAA